MNRFVALLRGINVGGNNKLPMAALREALTGAGFAAVATYIQSGNVVLSSDLGADADSDRAVADAVHRCILDSFGLDVDVVVRDGAELLALHARGPRWPSLDRARSLVLFYPDAVDLAVLESIVAARFLPDSWHGDGREIHLYLPDGIANSKLVIEIGRKLPGGTARNWNTVARVAAMLAPSQ